jgi:hypothetical protein
MIELDKLAFFPKCLLNLCSGHQLTGFTGEKSEQSSRLILQSNAPAVLSKLYGIQVELKRLETETPGPGWR